MPRRSALAALAALLSVAAPAWPQPVAQAHTATPAARAPRDFCRGCAVARAMRRAGPFTAARILAESPPGRRWRPGTGTGVTVSFHVTVRTRAGEFVVRAPSSTEGVRERFAQTSSPVALRAVRVRGAVRVVAEFRESVTGESTQALTRVLVLCQVAASGVPACLVVRGARLLPDGDVEDEGAGPSAHPWTPLFP